MTTAAASVLAAGFGVAGATSSAVIPAGTIHGCITGSTRTLERVYTDPTKGTTCPTGSHLLVWNQTGPQGPQGNPGKDATLSVTATTAVSNWPESSGWATDNFTRTVTVTRDHAVPAADCGATANTCYFYTESLGDTGSVTTTNGHASPNGSDTGATIAGVWTGPMSGGGKLEFYASSGSPSAALVPGTAANKVCGSFGPCTTTRWYEMFFPAGTLFGDTTGANAPWTTYDWNYSVQVTCGTSNIKTQTWNDGINPGDDGQGTGDGDITGTNGC